MGIATSENGCPRDFDYFPNGGMRNFYCHLRTLVSLASIQKSAPRIWRSGPHQGGVSLNEERDFGRYDPRFVRWLIDNGVPGAKDSGFKKRTQVVFDKIVGPLARVYLRAAYQLDQSPAYLESERAYLLSYLKNPKGQKPLYRHGKLEPRTMYNVYAPAMAFWVRRDVDGTRVLFVEGLEKLVRTYDPLMLKELRSLKLRVDPPGAPDSPEGTGVAQGSLPQMIEAAWRGLGRAKNACPDVFAYEPGGAKINYCFVKSLLSYRRVQSVLPMKIFLSGPHTRRALALEDTARHGRYNPKFVRWLVENGVPAASNPALLKATQGFYDKRFKVSVRAFYVARKLQSDAPKLMKKLTGKYFEHVRKRKQYNFWGGQWERFPSPSYEFQAIGASALGFWVRRSLDGTDGLFEQALEKLMKTYDAGFLGKARAMSFSELKGSGAFLTK